MTNHVRMLLVQVASQGRSQFRSQVSAGNTVNSGEEAQAVMGLQLVNEDH